MADVDKGFDYYGKSYYLRLDADQGINPYTWKPPIRWTGVINGVQVTFVQIEPSAYRASCFDFSELPERFQDITHKIAEEIDKSLRTMD